MATTTNEPNISIQWKGTNACFDFYCDCGTCMHCDGDFIYFVRCPVCNTVYEMPTELTAVPVDPDNPPEWYVGPDEAYVGHVWEVPESGG